MDNFTSKKVWHSMLKYKSPLVVMFGTGQLVDSKYEEGQQIIYFTVRGDEKEYYYQIESFEIAKDLGAVVAKEWYSLEAGGGKGDATITLTPIAEGDLPAITTTVSDKTVPAGFKEGYAPPSQSPGEFNLGSQEANMEACLRAAMRMVDDVLDGADNDVIERLAVSMFIQSNMNRFVIPVSTDDATVKGSEDVAPTEPEDTGPDLSDLKELAAGLPLHTGTSHDGKQLKRALDKIANTESMSDEEYESALKWVLAEADHQTNSADDEDLPF